jgi:hypothetical protein
MANLLAKVNNWFQAVGLGTDWTITWEVLFSFSTAIVSLFAFAIKQLFINTSSKPAKADFEHQQNDILEKQSAIYFNGEVIIFFSGIYNKGQNYESTKSKVKFMSRNGKFSEEDFDIFTNGQWDSRSHSFQGFNDYEIQLAALERAPDKEISKATYSVIKIPKKIRFFKQVQFVIIAFAVGLLAHAVLLARFGETIMLSGFSIPIIVLSGFVTWLAWYWIKK